MKCRFCGQDYTLNDASGQVTTCSACYWGNQEERIAQMELSEGEFILWLFINGYTMAEIGQRFNHSRQWIGKLIDKTKQEKQPNDRRCNNGHTD